MGKSIFELAEQFYINSPWEENWENEEFQNNVSSTETKQSVQTYKNSNISVFKNTFESAQKEYNAKFEEYKAYYIKINKVKATDTREKIYSVFSAANKAELERISKKIENNKALKLEAETLLKNWNKLDVELVDVVDAFNKKEKFSSTERLDPSLVKALMFSETEMGTGIEYKDLVKYVVAQFPNAIYQLNLGRVTDRAVYTSVKTEFSIPVNEKTNYTAYGNKNDVMLCAGALIQKDRYARDKKKGNKSLQNPERWFNAVVAYKGASEEGKGKANLVWNLYKTGQHPYSIGVKLF